MYQKLPKTLFKHKYIKFPSAPGYSNDGILIFTSEEKARKYKFTDGASLEGDAVRSVTKAYTTISTEDLILELETKR